MTLAFLLSPIPLAFAAAILFGLAIVVAQRGVRVVPSLPGAAVANLTAAVLFWLVSPWFWDAAGASTLGFGVFLLVGLFFPATVTLLMLESNRRMGPSITAAVSGTTPLFAYFGAVLFLGEALLARGVSGTAAIVIGIAILVWRRNGRHERSAPWTVGLPVGSALIRAIAQLLSKFGLTLWPSAFCALLIAYTASAALTCGLTWLKRERWPIVPALGWFAASGIMNGFAVLAMLAAFRDGDVTVVAPIVATAPLVTLIASAWLTRAEAMDLRLVLGVLATLTGVMLILWR